MPFNSFNPSSEMLLGDSTAGISTKSPSLSSGSRSENEKGGGADEDDDNAVNSCKSDVESKSGVESKSSPRYLAHIALLCVLTRCLTKLLICPIIMFSDS